MKTVLTIILIVALITPSFSQKKEFEGVIQYKTEVKSKVAGIDDKLMGVYLAVGDNIVSYMKNGNYLRSTSASDQYYINSKQRVYIKFKNLDTLYYIDYSSDTTTVSNIARSQENKKIAGYNCNSITISSSKSSKKYYYAPELYNNPLWDANNTIGNFDRYVKETESVWLSSTAVTENYELTEIAKSVEFKNIDDDVFKLPSLPEKLFTIETVSKAPEYTRNGGWIKYLETNANAALGSKYIKIPKGETLAQQSVIVSFLISVKGEIQDIRVVNNKEVHPKLAEEAVRLVTESRNWKSGTIFGEKIPFRLNQSITFQAAK